ncbi:MAG: hypothetical protein LBC59_00920 [Chitinispirillales bacterium]|nr:hypothetical protein [Chitinispirillales bacterium]
MAAALALSGCAARVSYNVTQSYIDPYFSERQLNHAQVAVLPFLTTQGVSVDGDLRPERVVRKLRALRPDMEFVSFMGFENSLPAPIDRKIVPEFYGKLYEGDILGVQAMDSLWAHIAQPYLLVYTLRAGAIINNVDKSLFKHASLVCELWSREQRAVVWRASCMGVSDDKHVSDARLMAEGMLHLAEAIPPTAPNYGREAW